MTDQEVYALIAEYEDELLRNILKSYYDLRREMGDSVEEAWKTVLTAHINAAETAKAEQRSGGSA